MKMLLMILTVLMVAATGMAIADSIVEDTPRVGDSVQPRTERAVIAVGGSGDIKAPHGIAEPATTSNFGGAGHPGDVQAP